MSVAIHDDDLIAERCAEAGVLTAIDPDVGPHVVAAADFCPPGTKAGPVVGHAAADDGDHASTRFKPQESLLDVTGSEGGAMAVDSTAGGREGWVHHDGVKRLLRGKEIIQTLGIKRRRLESLQGE